MADVATDLYIRNETDDGWYVIGGRDTLETASFVTVEDETAVMPYSRMLMPGPGLLRDISVPGEVYLALGIPGTVTVSTGNVTDTPHTHAVTSSSDPGSAAILLASADDGGLELVRLGIGTDPDTDNAVKVVDDAWIGLSSAAGRLVFDATPAPDQIEVTAADLYFATASHGIIHVDGVAAGQVLVADGTRYVPGSVASAIDWAEAGDLSSIEPDDAANAGVSTEVPRADHQHAIVCATAGTITPDAAAAEGSASSFARSDHTHAITCDTAGTIEPDDAAAEGAASYFSRSDHQHAITCAAPGADSVNVAASAEGSATYFSRSDHTHNLDEDINPTWTGEHIFSTTLNALADLNNPAYYPVVIRNPANDTGEMVAIGFYIDANENDVGGAIGFVRNGAESQGELRFYTKNSVASATDPELALSIESNNNLLIYNLNGDNILSIRASGDVAATEADIYAESQLGLAADDNVYVFIDVATGGTTRYFAIARHAESVAGAAEVMRVTENGLMLIGDTANTNSTIGLTIDQSTNDNEILTLQSSTDVGHGGYSTDTNTYFCIQKVEGGAGGANLRGFKDNAGAAGGAVSVDGFLDENVDTTHSTAGRAIVEIRGFETSGGSLANTTADGNVCAFLTRRGGSVETVAIIDEDGDLHLDAGGGAGGTIPAFAFDDYDDLALLTGLRASIAPDGHEMKERFREFIEYARPVLETAGVVHYNDGPGQDSRPFVSARGLQYLTIDAMRQFWNSTAEELHQLRTRVAQLEAKT